MDRRLTRIGYVEDDPDIRAIAEIALADVGGLEVSTFDCGEAAVNGMAAVKPDLILLDVMMPGMDGETTLQRLRAQPDLADTPVVFMTAKTQRHEVERYKAAGAHDVIMKPFDPMTLADQLRALWSEIEAPR